MNFEIGNIEFADCRIIEMLFSKNYTNLSIIFEESYHIGEKTWLGKTKLIISNWKDLTVEKYVTKSLDSKGQTFIIDWEKESETFEMIQESLQNENDLSLSGFSKETGNWLTYNFKNCDYTISLENNHSY